MIVALLKRISLAIRLRRLEKAGCPIRDSHCNYGFKVVAKRLWPERLVVGRDGVLEATVVFEKDDSGSVCIGDRCHIGGNTKLISIDGIRIGSDVTIAWDCTIYDHDSHPLSWEDRSNDTFQELADLRNTGDFLANKDWSKVRHAPIAIHDRAWIGFGATILKGVTVGEGAIVGAQSVVTRDVPPYSVAAGNPARIVRTLLPGEGKTP